MTNILLTSNLFEAKLLSHIALVNTNLPKMFLQCILGNESNKLLNSTIVIQSGMMS